MNGAGVRQISMRNAWFSSVTASALSAAIVSRSAADKAIPISIAIVFMCCALSQAQGRQPARRSRLGHVFSGH
jgi:hypothetical protein